MHRILAPLALFVLFVGVFAPAVAGDKKKETIAAPKVQLGDEHRLLESLAGTFDCKVKVYFPDPAKPSETRGVMTRTMILGGNFLQESFTGEFFGTPFRGMGIVGFDVQKKKFTTTWCDSMSTSIMIMHGSYDADKKVLTSLGEDFDATAKKMMKARDTLKILNADEQHFEMYRQPEGEKMEFKVMEITYKRRKAEK